MQNVLFLCTDNSARSIMAEALLRHWGEGQLTAFSAGSHPAGEPHPVALKLLEERGVAVHGLRSKSWDEFANPHAAVMDLVITVCDVVANEASPVLPGNPIRVHWSLPDPAAAIGDETARHDAFATVCEQLEQRIAQLVTIPFADRDSKSVQADLESIAAIA
jgi:arsenate reductase